MHNLQKKYQESLRSQLLIPSRVECSVLSGVKLPAANKKKL